MKYDLVICDYDGTLGDGSFISQENLDAIKRFTNNGGKFAICTGRMFSSIKAICKSYNINCMVASYQGASIDHIGEDKNYLNGGLDNEMAQKVVKRYLEEGLKPTTFIDEVLNYEEHSPYVDFYLNLNIIKLKKVESLLSVISDYGKSILKINGVCLEETAKRLTPILNKEFGGEVVFNNGGPNLIEAVNPMYSKGMAVRFICKHYNVPFEKTLVMGDSTNDLEMFKGPWYKVAVGDANQELKNNADEITVPFKDNAVKFILDKYCL